MGYIISTNTNDDLKFYCYYKKLNTSDDTGDNVFTSNTNNTNNKYNIEQININTIQRYSYEFKNKFPLIEYFYLFKKNIINIDYDFLWKIDENKLLRFDGYEHLDYGDSNKNIFSNIEKIIEKKICI